MKLVERENRDKQPQTVSFEMHFHFVYLMKMEDLDGSLELNHI